jgi:hypothetical protein
VESTIETFRAERVHLGFTMLNTMYFQSILTNKCAQLSTQQLCNLGFRLLLNQFKKLKTVPVRYFMEKHFGFSRFPWNPISKILKWRWWRMMDDAIRDRLSAYGLDSHWIRICCICVCAVTSGYPVMHELIRNLHYLCEGEQHPIGWSLIAVVLHPHNEKKTACAFSISFSPSSTSIACPLLYHDLLAHARKHYYRLSVTIHSLYPSSLRLF